MRVLRGVVCMTKSSVPRTEPWGYAKTAKPTEMPFEMWTCVGPMNHVLRWGPGPLEERAIFFRGCMPRPTEKYRKYFT